MNSPTKIDLVYIASIGRSGSTLLESMLGAHSQMATLGEAHIWPHEITQQGITMPCGCGLPVPECAFWTEMRRYVDPLQQEGPGIHFFREKHNAGRTLRLRRLKAFGSGEAAARKEGELIQAYGRNNQEVYQAFLTVTKEMLGRNPRWVVDASKDPYRLLWLVRSGLFNIKVVHLVKDPRGFIYSVTKPHIHGRGFTTHRRFYWTARQSLAWLVQNYLIFLIAKNHLAPTDYALIQYEELASHPEETFRRVCEVIGCGYEAEAVAHFREGSVHTIAGNPMRYEQKGISLDEKWKTALPQSSQWLVKLITSIDMSRYGYS